MTYIVSQQGNQALQTRKGINTMTTIYDQHDAAFRQVSAFVILKDKERVATIAFKFPKDGAGILWAYVHFFGSEMVRGRAGGYGYDKRSAAIEHAAQRMLATPNGWQHHQEAFHAAIKDIGGNSWDRALQDAGFTVLQAV
jgi:hypothetical protein